jgi:MinD-like ATPase involved in chromosome partitioning or flagellar assembly
MSGGPAEALKRRDLHRSPLVDGRSPPNGTAGRLRRQVQRLLVSQGERHEAEIERRILTQPGVTRPNTIALVSPKGGVGKTTSTFITGNLLATHLKLRAIAVDANPDFGTLARLAPDDRRSERSLADLLGDADRLNTAAELAPYVSRLPTGLHVLGAPRDAELTASLGPDRYGELVAFLATFYEVVLLDLGTGVAGPLARFAIERADQVVLVTTPEWVTSTVVLEALSHLRHDHTTVAINKSHLRSAAVELIEDRFRAEHLHRAVTIPHDDQLATMLDSGTYTLEALGRPTRLAVKRLGLAVAEQLA